MLPNGRQACAAGAMKAGLGNKKQILSLGAQCFPAVQWYDAKRMLPLQRSQAAQWLCCDKGKLSGCARQLLACGSAHLDKAPAHPCRLACSPGRLEAKTLLAPAQCLQRSVLPPAAWYRPSCALPHSDGLLNFPCGKRPLPLACWACWHAGRAGHGSNGHSLQTES